MGPCGQHRGLGGRGAQRGRAGTRVPRAPDRRGFPRPAGRPANLPAPPPPCSATPAPHTLICVRTDSLPRKTLSASHVQSKPARGAKVKTNLPSRPGRPCPKPSRDRAAAGDHGPGGVGRASSLTPPGTDGAARGGRAPDHSTDRPPGPCPRPRPRLPAAGLLQVPGAPDPTSPPRRSPYQDAVSRFPPMRNQGSS